MKVNVKKALATLMSAMLIVTSGQCPVASAAKKPVLNSKKVTLKVGQKKTLKVKNKIKGSTYKWKSSKVKVAKVSKKGVVKALKKGTATITCKVKTKATKKKKAKTYTLKCKVTVKKKKTTKPTAKPTAKPTKKPTVKPSDTPSDIPSNTPVEPTLAPSDNPSTAPSADPSASPSADPSASPSVSPSASPSASPSTAPSYNYHRPGGNGGGGSSTVKDTVANVDELKAAVAANKTPIIFSTQASGTFDIPSDLNSSNVYLIVDAPNAHINNEATFKSITIQAIGENTWVEKAKGNYIVVKAKEKAHINLAKGAEPKAICVDRHEEAKANPEIKITADGGTVPTAGIQVVALVNLTFKKGDNATGSDAIKVDVAFDKNAQGVGGGASKVVITSEVKVAITAKIVVDLNVVLSSGAEGSKIKAESSSDPYKVTVNNGTNETVPIIPVTDGVEGTPTEVTKGEKDKEVTIEASADEEVVAKVKEALEANDGNLIKGENLGLNNVTKALNLYNSSDKYTGVATGASIVWEVPEGTTALVIDGTADSDGKYPVTIQQESKEVTVTLTATITKNKASATATFTIKIPADESSKPDTTVNVTLSTVACTVATGQSIIVDGSNVTGSSITLTKPSPTVTVGGTEDESAKIEISYALSVDKPNDEVFSNTLSLELPDTDKSKKLWVKVTVTPSEATEPTTKYFASEVLSSLSTGTISVSEQK